MDVVRPTFTIVTTGLLATLTSVVVTPPAYAVATSTVSVVGSTLQVVSAPGIASQLVFAPAVSSGTPVYRVSELGSGALSAQSPCTNQGSLVVECPQSAVASYLVDVGDGDDVIDLTLLDVPGTLWGRAGRDFVDSGLAADDFHGGEDEDQFSYESRTNPVQITLDELPNDGYPGEGDNVRIDSEVTVGGVGDDHYLGSDAPAVVVCDHGYCVTYVPTFHGGPGDDWWDGGLGRDTFVGGPGSDTVDYSTRTKPVSVRLGDFAGNTGVSGEKDENDVVLGAENAIGGSGADMFNARFAGDHELPGLMVGGAGADTFIGGERDDMMVGGPGADDFTGYGGLDCVSYAERTAPVTVTAFNDTAFDGEAGEKDNVHNLIDCLIGGSGNDNLNGSSFADTLKGGPGKDVISGTSGNDVLVGGQGSDIFHGGLGFDEVSYADHTTPVTVTMRSGANDGSAGEADSVGDDIEAVRGGSANDSLTGSAANDTLIGGAGDDLLFGGSGDDVLDGQAGADVLSGGLGLTDTATYAGRTAAVRVSVGGGADDGSTGEGDDVRTDVEKVVGGSGDDVLIGDASTEFLWGGAGDDLFDGGAGADQFYGGVGTDTVTYQTRMASVAVKLDNTANDGASGEADNIRDEVEVVIGGLGADTLTGSARDDRLFGSDGNDKLAGLGGADYLVGGAGFDSLDGGDGSDFCAYDAQGDVRTNCELP